MPTIFRLLLTLTAFCGSTWSSAIFAAERPNVILIMSDDMGYSDLGCYGGEINTPNLDSLAHGGVRFTQFYNTARCCPTRASLLTGLYPHQAGVGHMTNDQGLEGYRGELNKNCVTIAEVLRGAGYSTYMTGKWHVTRNDNANGDKSAWPIQRGFDKFYGTIRGGGSFYDPTGLTRQNTFITPVNDADYRPDEFYYTDSISDNAVKFLSTHAKETSDKPFFLYVAYTAAHWPMHALEKDIAKYRGKYAAGYEPIRAARFEKMKKLGLIPADTELTTEPNAWDKVANKDWEARCMEVYAAMIDNMDAGIGRITAELKRSGQFDNTLILFLQDNGGCAEGTGRQNNGAGPSDLKPFGPDDLQPKVTPPMQTRDGRWVKTGPQVMPGPKDSYVAYGRDWARVSNTPFREFKHWNHEGGISTPLVAHWPRGIAKSLAGKLARDPGHLIDLMATCVDVSGAKYPTEFAGEKIKPLEGRSLQPALRGEPVVATPRALFWEHEGNRADREGNWKLVAKENQAWELYDIDQDRTELHDLAQTQPERVQDLAAKWDAYAARANVLPLGGWRGKAAAEALSQERKFVLKAGDELPREKAPNFVDRAFTVTAKYDAGEAKEGVIVAHGGSQQGYALYLVDGKPTFALRRPNALFTRAAKSAPRGLVTVRAEVTAKGAVKLFVNDELAAEGDAGSTPRMPGEGVQVGRDEGGAVGNYAAPHAFVGKIETVTIELDPAK